MIPARPEPCDDHLTECDGLLVPQPGRGICRKCWRPWKRAQQTLCVECLTWYELRHTAAQ